MLQRNIVSSTYCHGNKFQLDFLTVLLQNFLLRNFPTLEAQHTPCLWRCSWKSRKSSLRMQSGINRWVLMRYSWHKNWDELTVHSPTLMDPQSYIWWTLDWASRFCSAPVPMAPWVCKMGKSISHIRWYTNITPTNCSLAEISHFVLKWPKSRCLLIYFATWLMKLGSKTWETFENQFWYTKQYPWILSRRFVYWLNVFSAPSRDSPEKWKQ